MPSRFLRNEEHSVAFAAEHANEFPRYDRSRTYRWNYDEAPLHWPTVDVPALAGPWTYGGCPVPSPLGIAAGPLLNGRWLLYYAALGFDILTYKTVRSQPRECYPLPNLQPVRTGSLHAAGKQLSISAQMEGDWAISFGMPSMHPDVWRADVEITRQRLPVEKRLSVSVVGTIQPGWSHDELADDFAQCARWAMQAGADCIETNFSCPNVSTCDGQLFQQPEIAAIVAHRVREAIGTTPYLIKIGFVDDDALAEHLIEALSPFAEALAMTNSISARVQQLDGTPLFDGQLRGIGGEAIRAASIGQVARFSTIARQRGSTLRMIGVGGIAQANHVREYLDAGAEAVQLATSAMLDPLVGCRIRASWSS